MVQMYSIEKKGRFQVHVLGRVSTQLNILNSKFLFDWLPVGDQRPTRNSNAHGLSSIPSHECFRRVFTCRANLEDEPGAQRRPSETMDDDQRS